MTEPKTQAEHDAAVKVASHKLKAAFASGVTSRIFRAHAHSRAATLAAFQFREANK